MFEYQTVGIECFVFVAPLLASAPPMFHFSSTFSQKQLDYKRFLNFYLNFYCDSRSNLSEFA